MIFFKLLVLTKQLLIRQWLKPRLVSDRNRNLFEQRINLIDLINLHSYFKQVVFFKKKKKAINVMARLPFGPKSLA